MSSPSAAQSIISLCLCHPALLHGVRACCMTASDGWRRLDVARSHATHRQSSQPCLGTCFLVILHHFARRCIDHLDTVSTGADGVPQPQAHHAQPCVGTGCRVVGGPAGKIHAVATHPQACSSGVHRAWRVPRAGSNMHAAGSCACVRQAVLTCAAHYVYTPGLLGKIIACTRG